MIIDDFNDNSIDTGIWTPSSGTDITVSESSSRINFTSDASYSGSTNSAGLASVATFDMTGKKFEIDIISNNGFGQFSGASSGMQASLISGSNNAYCYIDGNIIGFVRSNNGVQSTGTIAYFNTHTKFRIEHNQFDNTWHFWTLTSGVWTRRFISAAANWNPTSCTVSLACYIYGANSVSRTTSYDNPTIDESTIPPPQRASFQPFFAQ